MHHVDKVFYDQKIEPDYLAMEKKASNKIVAEKTFSQN